MNKPKVYLAKSNLCDPNQVMQVRSYLQQFNIDIVEFCGGIYDNKPLLKSDYLIVIPSNPNQEEYPFIIGKGIFNQITEFEQYECDKYPMILTYCRNNVFNFKGISHLQKYDDPIDWNKYAELFCDKDDEDIKISEIFKLKESSKNKYLLLIS